MTKYLKGETNLAKLARETGLTRTEVSDMLKEWRSKAASTVDSRERARTALAEMDEHYSLLIGRAWESVEQADDISDIRTKVTAIKAIADIEAKRQETLQKAGFYDDAEMGNQMAVMTQQAEAIKEMLLRLVEKYPDTKKEILEGLQRIFAGQNISVPVAEHLPGIPSGIDS